MFKGGIIKRRIIKLIIKLNSILLKVKILILNKV